jgi:HEXXH motif-containing protein
MTISELAILEGDGVAWGRLAEPQEDGYDTGVIAAFAHDRYGFRWKLERPPAPAWLDGWVPLVRHDAAPDLPAAPFDHPHLALGERLLGAWPAFREQARLLLTAVAPIWHPTERPSPDSAGCSCGGLAAWGGVTATLDSPPGFAAGVAHELGHWKLHALGVHLEDWDGLLLLNRPDELYDSPIRKDKLRPMGAVLQAQYSYLHVLDLEARMARAGERHTMHDLNARRVAEGAATIRAHARLTEAGEAFVGACLAWGDRIVAEAAALPPPAP